MMQVILLDFTGNRAPNPARAAAELLIYAKSTRLTQGAALQDRILAMSDNDVAKELAAIALSVRSSWEFVDYTFQVLDVSRASTHQMARSRHSSIAQQAMRITDMNNFDVLVPESVSATHWRRENWSLVMEAIRTVYRRFRDDGVPAEDARGVLPTNILTNIMIKKNLRTLAEEVGKRDNLRAQGEHVEVMRAMATAAMAVHPWAEQFLYPPRLSTPALNELLATALAGKPPAEVPLVNDALKELDRLKGTWG